MEGESPAEAAEAEAEAAMGAAEVDAAEVDAPAPHKSAEVASAETQVETQVETRVEGETQETQPFDSDASTAGCDQPSASPAAACAAAVSSPPRPPAVKTFSRKPQQAKLQGFVSKAPPPAASERAAEEALVAMPQGVDEALEEAAAAEAAEAAAAAAKEAAAAVEAAAAAAREAAAAESASAEEKSASSAGALIDGEAEESGDSDGGEEGEEEDEEEIDAEAEAEAADGEGPGMHMREQARREAEDDAREIDAIQRGLKRDQRAPAGGDDDAAAASDDELRSLGDFIADSDEEDLDLAPAVEEEPVEASDEEDESAKLIRSKLGDKWVIGDRACPQLVDRDDSPEKRSREVREARFKRKREAAAAGADKKGGAASSLGGRFADERSQTLWGMLGGGGNSSSALAGVGLSRQASNLSAPPVERSGSSGAIPAARKAGSFQGKFSEAIVGKLGNAGTAKKAGGGAATSFSKGFVFSRGEDSSHGGANDRTPSSSKAHAAPHNPQTEMLGGRRAEKVDARAPLGSFNSAAKGGAKSGGRAAAIAKKGGGGSLLAQVLSKSSKKWGASKA